MGRGARGTGGDEAQTEFRPLSGDSFRFRCHPGIACFTRCCAALRLRLTPYDVLRLKRALQLPSDRFLDQYTETSLTDHERFPMLRLRMGDDPDKRCPFVTPKGCSVYADRPGACRLYPIGRAAATGGRAGKTREKFFVVAEAHCRGFEEDREWTLQEWVAGEGLESYNRMNDAWLEIIGDRRSLGSPEGIPRKLQMFSMVSYNLDRFRAFLFDSRFLSLFDLSQERQAELAANDEALLQFGFAWLKFSLFGDPTIPLRAGGIPNHE